METYSHRERLGFGDTRNQDVGNRRIIGLVARECTELPALAAQATPSKPYMHYEWEHILFIGAHKGK